MTTPRLPAYFRRRYQSTRKQLLRDETLKAIRGEAMDVIKSGIGALILNAWLQEVTLLAAAVTAITVGLLAWMLALHADQPGGD